MKIDREAPIGVFDSGVGSHTNIYPLSSVRGFVPAKSIYKKQGEVVEKQ